MHLLRHQRLEIQMEAGDSAIPVGTPAPLSRAERTHSRLSWAARLARNARLPAAGPVRIALYGVPADFASSLGLPTT